MNPNQSKNDPRRPLIKRAAHIGVRIIEVLGALVALVAIAVGGTFLVLRTDWGGERLRRLVVSRVNAQIQGNLELKRLSFGGDRLVLSDVALVDPEGQLVAQLARAEVDFSLKRLLHKEIRLTAVEIERPVVGLVSRQQGLNLSRALSPQKPTRKNPSPPSPKTTKEGWVIRLDRFDLTGGDLALALAEADSRDTKVHVSDLRLFVSVRYATGNGSFDLTLRLDGDDQLAPGHPLRLVCEASGHSDVYRFDVNGELLGGSIKARGNIDAHHLADADGLIALAIPRQALAGHDWGPFGIDGAAHPGTSPRLNALLAIPGVELAVKTRDVDGDGDSATPDISARLTAADLELTARAIHALTGTATPALAGRGQLTVAVHGQDVAATVAMASPTRLDVNAAGRLDDDRHGFALNSLTVAFPGDRWTSQGTALLRFDSAALSLANLRLVSGRQALAVDGSKHADDIAGHVALTGLRLDHLPAALVDRSLQLDGELDADLAASGRIDAPKVVANVQLKQGRYQGFSKVDARLEATLHDQQVDGTMTVEAPYVQANAAFNASTNVPDPGAPLDLRLDVKRLNVAQVLRAAGKPPIGDGRVNVQLRLKGSADQPDLAVTVAASELTVTRPVNAAMETAPIDVGHARVHFTYAARAARLNVDFRSAHGGTLLADAAAHADLSYLLSSSGPTPGRIVLAKLPIRGKVAARDFDVAWVARFSPRVESMAGQLTADARISGTVSDPQLVGDLHWKNGQVVTTTPPAAAAAGQAPSDRRQAAGRPSPSSIR